MVRRIAVLAVVTTGVASAVALGLRAAPAPDRPVAVVVGHTGLPAGSQTTTTVTASPAVAATPPTTTRPVVVANRSSTVVEADAGRVRVVNSGSAVASTGGNTVIGGPESATVANGPVTAVGNSSEVRITRP